MDRLDGARIWDISPVVSDKLAVWPGDMPFNRNISLSYNGGHNLVLSSIQTTLHIGAHADASNHYHRNGVGIDQRDLRFYLGPAQVMTVKLPRSARILPEHLIDTIQAPRVLYKPA